jgi:hypothetical protein
MTAKKDSHSVYALEGSMRDHPDHHDAELLLRLYDLRRETKLRQAREWYMREYHAESAEEHSQKYPLGTPENANIRMVVSYWDMAASIVAHGLINEDFFFENTTELWLTWARIGHIVPALRAARKNSMMWKNLEDVAGRFEKWAEKRAPEALDTYRQSLTKSAKK